MNGSRRRMAAALTVVLTAAAFGACRGENIFSLTATVAPSVPDITITAPSSGFTMAPGDSVLVLAEVTAQEGITTVALAGEYADSSGEQAFFPMTVTGSGVTFLRVNEYLAPVVTQGPGDVYIKVIATDAAGAIGRDSVKIGIISTN